VIPGNMVQLFYYKYFDLLNGMFLVIFNLYLPEMKHKKEKEKGKETKDKP
jgi:hypothetical protein